LEPDNPSLPGARLWLEQEEARQTIVISATTLRSERSTKPLKPATFTPDKPVTGPLRPPKLGYQLQQTSQPRVAYRHETPGLSERVGLGWQFMKQAARMARDDSNLLKPSFYAIGLNVLVSLLLALPLFLIYLSAKNEMVIYLAVFVALLVNYFITYFFSAATIHLVHQHLTAGTSHMSLAWAVAKRGSASILAVAAVSALIGTFRRVLTENERGIFGIIAGLVVRAIEAVWTTATYFILPAIVIEDLPMGAAVKRATQVIRQNLLQVGVGVVGLGIICALVSLAFTLVGLGLGALALFSLLHVNLLLALILALALVVIMLAISSALNSYLRIAYYTCMYSWALGVERLGVYAPAPAPLRIALQSRAYLV
jgi:hypothetical protein